MIWHPARSTTSQYFNWQWAKACRDDRGVPGRPVRTLIFLSLGLRGSFAQRRADRAAWWLLFALFMVTGLGLVVYMNFKPGFSAGSTCIPTAAITKSGSGTTSSS